MKNRAAVQRRYVEKYRTQARAQLDELKRHPCADCGGTFDPICMDFDHRPGEEKRDHVSDLVARGYFKAAIRETAKCDVVCANCHRIRTRDRRIRTPLLRAPSPQLALSLKTGNTR